MSKELVKMVPEKKGLARWWPFIVIAILAVVCAIVFIGKDNAEKTLRSIKENHPGVLQEAKNEKLGEEVPKPVMQPSTIPAAVTVSAAEPKALFPGVGTDKPVPAPVVTPSEPTKPTLEQRVGKLEQQVGALGTWANAVSPCIDNLCTVKQSRVDHTRQRAEQVKKSNAKVSRIRRPSGYVASVQQATNPADCQVPSGTTYPDRFMPAGPGCSGKTCLQYRQQ
ncbi:MAG: hypothetical protein HGB08_04445 [Candidatus Moranbacteria bacterium]|nr:hypothetical protein [Candidatus Moranbacteria bacterium]